MSNKKPLILITNDDGDTAKGIQVLTKVMMELGDVIVMAPDGPRSGQSNALTVQRPIRFTKIEEQPGLVRYKCNGTPTDCVKLALNEVVERKPDLLVSGINHGSNAAINVIYSGTMGAVLEGCENDVPSIGFSICNFDPDADFSEFEPHIKKIALQVLEHGLPYGLCLNVNSPKSNIKGLKVARQCEGHWTQEFAKATDPRGHNYYWLTGHFENHEPDAQDTDEWALANGYISVVPTKIDMTGHEYLEKLKGIFS
ncbi:5'/3'-nucleotidase SurE [Paludibacter sp.]